MVGYVYSSYYASIEKETSTVGNGTVGMVMFIPEQDFALDVYTDMFVTLSDAKRWIPYPIHQPMTRQ